MDRSGTARAESPLALPSGLRVGARVMLVGTDGFMPPMGAIGTVVGPLDEYGDHEVDFPAHPWRLFPGHDGPVSPAESDTWEVPAKWLMPLDDDGQPAEPTISLELPQTSA